MTSTRACTPCSNSNQSTGQLINKVIDRCFFTIYFSVMTYFCGACLQLQRKRVALYVNSRFTITRHIYTSKPTDNRQFLCQSIKIRPTLLECCVAVGDTLAFGSTVVSRVRIMRITIFRIIFDRSSSSS